MHNEVHAHLGLATSVPAPYPGSEQHKEYHLDHTPSDNEPNTLILELRKLTFFTFFEVQWNWRNLEPGIRPSWKLEVRPFLQFYFAISDVHCGGLFSPLAAHWTDPGKCTFMQRLAIPFLTSQNSSLKTVLANLEALPKPSGSSLQGCCGRQGDLNLLHPYSWRNTAGTSRKYTRTSMPWNTQ